MTVFTIPNFGEVKAGFLWEPWYKQGVPTFKEIKSFLDTYGYEIYCQYHATSRTSLGILREMDDDYRYPSLACLAAESIRENWVGIFQIGQYFWVGAGHNAHPFPLSDLVYQDIDKAHEHLIVLLRLGEFTKLFLPYGYTASSDIRDIFKGAIEHVAIEKVIDQDAPQVFARALHQSMAERFSEAVLWFKGNSKKALTYSLASIAGLSALSFIYFSFVAPGAARMSVDEEMLAQQTALLNKQKEEKSWAEFRQKWETLPRVRNYYNECSGNLLIAMQPLGTWKADRFICDPNGIKIVYRGSGALTDLQPLERSGYSLQFLSTEQYRAEIRFVLPNRGEGPELISLQAALEPLVLQREKLFRSMQKGNDVALGLPRGIKAEDSRHTYFQTTVSIEGVFDPDQVVDLLDLIPGFAITGATFDDKTYEWDFTGVLYHVQ